MLKTETREKLVALIKHPEFDTVNISDSKIVHTHNEGKPSFYNVVNIHAHGLNVFTLLGQLVPELQVENIRPYQSDRDYSIAYGELSDGKIEGASVNIWAEHTVGPKTKEAPLPQGAEETTQLEYNPLGEVVQ